ncbi:MAG: malto-oligosyltrehalose trehalohydrolase, partial [Chloroflexota bacterium]
FNLSDTSASVGLPLANGAWHKRLDSADEKWLGNGSSIPDHLSLEGQSTATIGPKSFVLFVREEED